MDNSDRVKILFVMLSMGFLMLAYGYMTLPEAKDCELRTTRGAVITGNCTHLYKLKYENTNIFNTFNESDKYNQSQIVTNRQCPAVICPEQVECPTPPTLGNCPACVCDICTKTACPDPEPCDKTIDAVIEHELLNMRYPGGGVAAVSFGYHECLMDVWDLLEIKDKPKFKITTSRRADWYKTVSGVADHVDDDDRTFCFKDLGGYFIINRTVDENGRKMWGWNDDRCLSSALRVNDL